jgi:hypothetical protein
VTEKLRHPFLFSEAIAAISQVSEVKNYGFDASVSESCGRFVISSSAICLGPTALL